MFTEIYDIEILEVQLDALLKKGFHPGFDHMDVNAAALWLSINGKKFSNSIKTGKYEPMPALGFFTAKSHGGYRNLTRITALDTIVQMSVLDVTSSYCEELFSSNSFAYRKGRGAGSALQLYVLLAQKYSYVGKIDVISCFDNINLEYLNSSLSSFFKEKRLNDLLMKMAQMPLIIDGRVVKREKGILQGAPISSLLCNIYFHKLDMALKSQDIPFIRYADDIVFFGNTSQEINIINTEISKYIENEMKLTLNPQKCHVTSPDQLKYLGYSFRRDKHGIIALESDSGNISSAYYNWNNARPQNNRKNM